MPKVSDIIEWVIDKSSIESVRDSDLFCVVAEKNYLDALENPTDREDYIIVAQLAAAKRFKKDTVIIYPEGHDLTPGDKEKLMGYLEGLDIVADYVGTAKEVSKMMAEDVVRGRI